MLSMVLFISGGEIAIILLFILIFFGADKIPEFARMMGKGVREFKKATDDIKREFTDSTSGLMNDIQSIQTNLTNTLTKEIAEPVQEIVRDTEKTFEEYQDQYQTDYYYDNPDDVSGGGNEYQAAAQTAVSEVADAGASASDTSGSQQAEVKAKVKTKTKAKAKVKVEPVSEPIHPAET